MAKKSRPSQTLVKVVNDLFPVKEKCGGGFVTTTGITKVLSQWSRISAIMKICSTGFSKN